MLIFYIPAKVMVLIARAEHVSKDSRGEGCSPRVVTCEFSCRHLALLGKGSWAAL